MGYLNLPVLSAIAAGEIEKKLSNLGIPPTDKIVIAISNRDDVTASGLIIPQGNKEDEPRKGTIVQVGYISEDYNYLKSLLNTGMIVTYGNYAGKEISPLELEGFLLKVISLNEIAYFEFPKK